MALVIIFMTVLLLINAVVGVNNTRKLNLNSQWVVHSLQVLDKLANVQSSLVDIQAQQETFVLTGDIEFLAKYRKLADSLPQQRMDLEDLIIDNNAQVERLAVLDKEISVWLEAVNQSVQQRGHPLFDPKISAEVNKQIGVNLNSIRQRLSTMENVERNLLNNRQMDLHDSYRISVWCDILVTLIALGLLAMAVIMRFKEDKSRNRLNEMLNQQKEWYRVTLKSIGDGLIATDAKGRITMMNAVAEQATGWRESEARGKPVDEVFQLIEQNTRQVMPSPVLEVLKTGQILSLASHSALISKDGSERPVEDSAAPICDRQGNTQGVVFVFRDTSELEKAKRNLELSEARYRALVDASAEIVWTTDPEGRVINDSESWRAFTGQTQKDFLGTGWVNALHPDDREKIKLAWLECVEKQSQYEVEYRLISANGEYRICKARGVPVLNHLGVVSEWVGMNIDITEERLSASKIEENELRFRQIAQLSGDWIWEQEPSGRYIYCNPVVKDILGFSPQEIIGKHYTEFRRLSAPPGSAEVESEHDRPDQKFFRVINHLHHKNGQLIITESSGEPVLDDSGNVVKWRGVDRDITERIQAADRFQAIIESTPVAVLLVKREGFICYANGFSEQLFGYRREELIDKPVELLIPERFRQNHTVERERYFTGPEKRPMGTGKELFALTRGGEEFRVEIALTPIRYLDEIVTVAMITDIRDRIRTEETLKQINRNQNNFLAFLGHELRNPLMPLHNAIQLLHENPADSEESSWAVGIIERQVNDLHHLIDDLLDICRISQGKITLDLSVCDVRKVIEHSVETVSPVLDKRNQHLIYQPPAEAVMINCDFLRLAQVFTNLLNNAAKFSQPGQTIWISFLAQPEAVEINIRDEGTGIVADDLTRIFELFTSVMDSSIEKMEGLGIGLTLSKEITELHGGRISAYSPGLGHGSTFTVRLPLYKAAAQSAEAASVMIEQAPKAESPALCYSILVTDDHPYSAETMAKLLDLKGFTAGFATSGQQAIDSVTAAMPDIVLLDIDLPDMSGLSVAQRLRSEEINFKGLLIAISGLQHIQWDKLKASGFDDFLIKPLEMETLLALIEKHFAG